MSDDGWVAVHVIHNICKILGGVGNKCVHILAHWERDVGKTCGRYIPADGFMVAACQLHCWGLAGLNIVSWNKWKFWLCSSRLNPPLRQNELKRQWHSFKANSISSTNTIINQLLKQRWTLQAPQSSWFHNEPMSQSLSLAGHLQELAPLQIHELRWLGEHGVLWDKT